MRILDASWKYKPKRTPKPRISGSAGTRQIGVRVEFCGMRLAEAAAEEEGTVAVFRS